MFVHLVLDPPESGEDAGVAEHDHEVGKAGHKGPVEVGEYLAPVVIDYCAGSLIIQHVNTQCSILHSPVFSMYPSSPQIPRAGNIMRNSGIRHPNKVRTMVRGFFNLCKL